MHIKRVRVNGETWFQVNDTHVFVDADTVCALVSRGVEVIDDDCVRVERERMARWN